MTSIKVKFRASTVAGKDGRIYYQIAQNQATKQIGTSYKVFAEEWDDASMQVILPPLGSGRYNYLESVRQRIKLDLSRLVDIVKLLERNNVDYSINRVVENFERLMKGATLFEFMQSVIARLVELRKFRTSETYQTALNSFMRFRGGENLLISDICSEMIMDYEVYLKAMGLTLNTISFYMRILRAVYNRAVEDDMIEQRYPFKKVYTGVEKTVKRALPIKDIKRIKRLDLTHAPDLGFARDMFLFSFYTRGMSFVDISYLRKSDLKNGILSYRRRKTGQLLHIKWEKCMQDIVDRYPAPGTIYLLPIIKNSRGTDRSQYRNTLCIINGKLKKIGAMVKSSIPITQYVARHSWASAAKNKHIPISVICEGMGHESETTTQIYLASLDNSIVDKANYLIINSL